MTRLSTQVSVLREGGQEGVGRGRKVYGNLASSILREEE